MLAEMTHTIAGETYNTLSVPDFVCGLVVELGHEFDFVSG